MGKHILILGGNGHIGQVLQQQTLPADWLLHPFSHTALDIADYYTVRDVLTRIKPDIVINAAAISSIEQCEADENLAMRTNFHGVAILARLCADADIPLIHLSTNYVFDGQKETPYEPDDLMNPINMYGKSKLMGEEAVRQTMPFAVILRLSSVFSLQGQNMLTRLLRQIDRNQTLYAAKELIIAPTCARSVAKAIWHIADQIMQGKHDGFGTFHLAGTPCVTRYAFMEKLLGLYSAYHDSLPELHLKSQAHFLAEGAVQRPYNAAMNCSKIKEIYGIEPEPWESRLAAYLSLYAQGAEKEESPHD